MKLSAAVKEPCFRFSLGVFVALLGFGASGIPERNGQPDVVPLPPSRPRMLAPSQAMPPTATPSTPSPSAAQTNQSVPAPNAVDQDCMDRLQQLGAKVQALPDIVDGLCHATHVVRLVSVSNTILLSPPATLQCPMAESVARWTNDVLRVSAKLYLGEVPMKILIGTSYACRTQNSEVNAKLSEHAFANGLDIMGFSLSGDRSVMIGPALEDQQASFAAEVRQKACTYFTTVLGPGSDAEHGNHLHVDLRQRQGNFHICQ